MKPSANMPTSGHRLINLDEVAARLHVSKAMVYRLIQRKEFFRPLKIGRASRWDPDQVNRWVERRLPAQERPNSTPVAPTCKGEQKAPTPHGESDR